jgi:multicomponent Na+:H+ antiporter subunit E
VAPECSEGILVPVGQSVTLRETVAYAVSEAEAAIDGDPEAPEAEEGAGDADDESAEAVDATQDRTAPESKGPKGSVALHFVYPASWRALDPVTEERVERAQQLLDRVAIWVREDLGIDDPEEFDSAEPIERAGLSLETALIGTEEYLFSPGDFARVLGEYAREYDLDRVIIDPEYEPAGSAPMLRPLEFELARSDLAVEEAPVERSTRRRALPGRGSALQFLGVFGLAYAFYLALGGFAITDGYELATGALSALIVAGLTWRVTVRRSVDPLVAVKILARFGIYVPYLLWEIAKANLSIAYVVLHPRLPIDPRMVRFEAAVFGDLSVTTLANSITLTPGTLTVDVAQRDFEVHALTADARADVLEGALERAVRFVFYGRDGATIASPTERAAGAAGGTGGAGDDDSDAGSTDASGSEGDERREGAA